MIRPAYCYVTYFIIQRSIIMFISTFYKIFDNFNELLLVFIVFVTYRNNCDMINK